MAKIKLIKSAVDAAQSQNKAIELRNTVVPGFLCKIPPAGRKVFMLQYRTNAGERRKPALGQYGELTVDQAHTMAQEWLAEVRRGGDPSAAKNAARKAPTIKEYCHTFMDDYSKQRNKPSTQRGYWGVINRDIIPIMGRMKVQDVKRPDVAAMMKKLADALIAQELATLRDAQRMTPALVMRDPYILDFLGLRDSWQEGDMEAAIIREMEFFLLELGAGFSFVARQRRIPIDDEDFYLDLLFYNRKLRRLVAVELKVGEFKAAYKGQMELYLRWLDKHEREPEEASPLGIILCTGKKREQIELLELDKSGIHVAEYLTTLPSRAVLGERLQQAIERARLQIEQRRTDDEQLRVGQPMTTTPKA